MKTVLGGLAVVLLLIVVYGVFIEPRLLLDDQRLEAQVPGLPSEWDGRRVGVVADFQIGMWMGNTGMIERALETAVEDSVSVLLVAGDFLYRPDSARAERAARLMEPVVAAGVPVVAVLGNHDYSLMKKSSEERPPIAEYLTERLRAAGVTVLENEATAVPAPGGGAPLWIAGIGSVWAEDSFPQRALGQVPSGAPRIVLMHNAESFRDIAPGEAPLAIGAHTHGGQISVIPGENTSWLRIVKEDEVVVAGWAADSVGAAGNRLYINRGIGFSTVPVRINRRPELTTVTLRSAPAGSPTARR